MSKNDFGLQDMPIVFVIYFSITVKTYTASLLNQLVGLIVAQLGLSASFSNYFMKLVSFAFIFLGHGSVV
jgi:hypothetical protein